MPLLTVRHNMEVAHRLYELPGKCENIHGHSMWVELSVQGHINDKGILRVNGGGLSFGDMKKVFRQYLDVTFDHHVLLNENDPFAGKVTLKTGDIEHLPGLQAMPQDPTTENLALWISEWASTEFQSNTSVTVHETSVNAATVNYSYELGRVLFP